ncbi:MAG: flagellar protein FlaB, partial [Deltaproteobacteria bacterium]|nr:flagellar protein FlaB [Deltaproteobacteria bacterium]
MNFSFLTEDKKMTLRINTNIAALNAHENMIKNDKALSASLEKLSSGLRINKAADDAAGMAIADSLRSQGLGLGQAIRNANDGISMVQTADGALQESINIVNSIKTKSIQAAQDGQTTDSRKAIQSDITKLMNELNNIAKTTSFNGQKLLSGNFTNKKFQVGAYSGETLNISIGSTESTKIGHISTSNLTFADKGTAALSIYSSLQNKTYNLNTIQVAYDNNSEHSLGAVADAINKLSDVLGITAAANVSSTTTNSVAAGTTDATFAINGVNIGSVAVQSNDANGALVAAINQKTSEHGVFASVDSQGKLTLTSNDNRAISVTQGTNTTAVLGATTSMSTLGTIALTQNGTSEIVINNRAGGTAVALTDNLLETSGVVNTTASSTMASGSTIVTKSTIGAGSILATGSALVATSGAVYTTGSSTLGSGTKLTTASIINSGTTLTASAKASGVVAGTGTLGSGSTIATVSTIGAGTTIHTTTTVGVKVDTSSTTGSSTLAKSSILNSGSTLAVGTTFLQSDIASSGVSGGSIVASGLYYRVTAATVTATSGTQTLTNGSATLASGSILKINSQVATDSSVGANIQTSGALTTNADMTLKTGTSLATASVLAKNTVITG